MTGPSNFKVQIHVQVLKRCFVPQGPVIRDLFAPPIGVKHPSGNFVHTSHGYCSQASNSSASVVTASYSK